MNIKRLRVIVVMVVLIAMTMSFAGCGIHDELDDDFGDKVDEGMSGGLADDSPKDVWPESMPERIPEFDKGNIVSNSSIKRAGQLRVEVIIEDANEEDVNEYISQIEQIDFEKQTPTSSGGITNYLFIKKDDVETTMAIAYAQKTGELIISFTGN